MVKLNFITQSMLINWNREIYTHTLTTIKNVNKNLNFKALWNTLNFFLKFSFIFTKFCVFH